MGKEGIDGWMDMSALWVGRMISRHVLLGLFLVPIFGLVSLTEQLFSNDNLGRGE